MSYDLELGFRSKPSDLTEVLQGQGFKLNRTTRAEMEDNPKMRKYFWFDKQKSRRGVHVKYTDEIDGDEEEEGLLELEPNLVAQATIISYMGRSDFDRQKQETVARFLRDHYKAVLYDGQEGTEVKD